MSALADLRFHTLTIPFRQRFSHASASRDATASVWVTATTRAGQTGHGEACPRSYVTGETLVSARAFFEFVRADVLAEIVDAASLAAWVTAHETRIDAAPAAWCAIELAVIDALARDAGISAEAWLGLPETSGEFRYSAVLGDAAPEVFAATFARYRVAGFTDYKLKLTGELARDRAKLAVLADPAVARLRLDANNLWPHADAAIATLTDLAAPAFAVEEPLAVAAAAELPAVARALDLAIILDESLTRADQLAVLNPGVLNPDVRWIANLRVSKLGGVLRSLAVLDAARVRGVGVIVGAQVGETSLLTRTGLVVAHAAGASLIAQEGAFGTQLLEHDVCDPSLMFGAGGVLHHRTSGTGWGLNLSLLPPWLSR
jgi:L-alanine-DL-glutamate epimerase-like enolase superfamily enzyme